MNPGYAQETARIQNEYRRRDATGLPELLYRYTNPAFMFHMQEREWAILTMLREAGFSLYGSRVLEVGCGVGHILQRFVEFGVQEAVGIDLMEARIAEGRRRYPALRLEQGNAAQLPYADAQFDLVMQFTCLSSVLEPSMRQRIAREIWRVVRPGGVILFYDLRPSPLLIRVLEGIRQRLPYGRESDRSAPKPMARDYPTPVQPLSLTEIRLLFNGGPLRYRSVSLDLRLARLAGTRRWIASLLSCLSGLRTHYLVVICKSDALRAPRVT